MQVRGEGGVGVGAGIDGAIAVVVLGEIVIPWAAVGCYSW
jgi:hypothetical protein